MNTSCRCGEDGGSNGPVASPRKLLRAADAVITMGCGDAFPIYPGKMYRDWEVEDPAGKDLDAACRIRDDIDRRVRELLDELS